MLCTLVVNFLRIASENGFVLFSCFLVFLIATDLVGKDPGNIQDWLQELTDRCYDETGCACYGKFVLRPQNRQGMKLGYLTNKTEKSTAGNLQ